MRGQHPGTGSKRIKAETALKQFIYAPGESPVQVVRVAERHGYKNEKYTEGAEKSESLDNDISDDGAGADLSAY